MKIPLTPVDDPWSDRVYALWDRLAADAPAHVTTAGMELMKTIATWIAADRAAWIGSIRLLHGVRAARDKMFGWRGRVMHTDRPPAPEEAKIIRRWLAYGNQAADPGLDTIAALRGAGRFRVHQLRDGFVDFDAFTQTGHYDTYLRQIRVQDRLWVVAPVSADTEVFYFFDRRGEGAKAFTPDEVQLAGRALRGLNWFHRQLLCGHGLLAAQSPLTPTERRVLGQLLTDKTERDIAAAMKQSPHTTHDHVRRIYQKLGVTGRTGLMAVWLNTPQTPRSPRPR